MSAVLVTGASGIAGAHVLESLRAAGRAVVPVSRDARDGWATADLADAAQVARLPAFEAVVHCAALTPRSGARDRASYEDANVRATSLLAVEAARRGVRRFVFVSTMGRREQQDDASGALYVASKREAERRLRDAAAGRFPIWILRAASLYGEHDRGSMARLIRAVSRGRFVALGTLRHRKCLLYAGSLARLIANELDRDAVDREEAAHDLVTYRFADVLEAVEIAVGRRAPRLPLPDGMARAGIRAVRTAADVLRAGGVSRLALAAAVALRDVPCDADNAIARLTEPIDLREGVRREVAWLEAHGRD